MFSGVHDSSQGAYLADCSSNTLVRVIHVHQHACHEVRHIILTTPAHEGASFFWLQTLMGHARNLCEPHVQSISRSGHSNASKSFTYAQQERLHAHT